MSPRQAGFSLLEVIAALLLLGIAFAALMQVAGSGLRLTQTAAERSEAAMWARNLLDSAFVLEPIRTGNSSGRFDPRFRWQLRVSAWAPAGKPAPAAPLQMYRLDLDVLWGSAAHPSTAHFSTLRLASADAAPGGNAP